LLQQARRRVGRHVAVDQRAAQRAIGMRAHQRGQGNPEGAPQRDRRHQADQSLRRPVVGGQRGGLGAAARGRADGQLPAGQVIAIRLDRALRQRAPLAEIDSLDRHAAARGCGVVRRSRMYRSLLRDVDHVPSSPFARAQAGAVTVHSADVGKSRSRAA
jgi:hypothetical protein